MSTETDEPTPSRLRSVADDATWPVRRAAMAVEKHVVWPGADAARSVAHEARWPFEQVFWAIRRKVAWPLADWFRSLDSPTRAAVTSAAVLAAAAAVFAGSQIGSPGGSTAPLAAAPAPVAAAPTPAPPMVLSVAPATTTPNGPVLHGATPTFAHGGKTTAQPENESGVTNPNPAALIPNKQARQAQDPVPIHVAGAGSDPIVVARRFSNAFVLYEIGKGDANVRKTFRQTATPTLARSLVKRPPRQPATVKVPKARVLNIVPGPREAKTQPVSVSLLRLGATSELRLMLNRTQTGWLVTDVRG